MLNYLLMWIKNAENNLLSTNKKPCLEYNKVKNNNIILKTNQLRVFLIIYLIVNFCLIDLSYCQNELAENLDKEFANLALSYPLGWEDYFETLYSSSQIKLDKFNLEYFEYQMEKIHHFNPDVITKFQSIIYEEYTIFKTFSFSIKNNESSFSEYIGAARIINNLIDIAYFEIKTFSDLKPVFEEIKRTICDKILFFYEVCREETELRKRNHNIEEMELILQTLKARSYEELHITTKNILSALQTKDFVLSENATYYSENGKFAFLVQEDGNMVIYQQSIIPGENSKPIWAIGTSQLGQRPYLLVIEKNGVLILYDSNWLPVWKYLPTFEVHSPFRLILTNEGILKVIDSKNNIIFISGNNPIKIDE